MNTISKLFLIAVAIVAAIPAFAVTENEMEMARTMAAKHYLRYANNGSDYLDKLNPASMSELNAALKTKEKENIKSFNAVAVPKDYASWDKEKLVQYWSSTFFKSPGLKEDGKKCLGILANKLKKINVSATAPAPDKPKESVETTPAAKPEETPQQASQPEATPVETDSVADEAELVAQAEADAGLTEEQPRKSSNTALYVGILVVLLGVVVWLVVYASRSMKESGASSDSKAAEKEIREAKKAAKEEINRMRDQYADSLTSKNEEIKQLKTQCEALEIELEKARRENAAVRRDLNSTKQELASHSSRKETPHEEPAPQTHEQRSDSYKPAETAPAQEKTEKPAPRQGTLPPVVFLGTVNQKGLFVKASKSINPESTVYKMDIPDGHHGVYRIAGDSKVLDRLLEKPLQWLAGGCIIENPEDADIATEIVTIEPGEAFFADNTCRVTKKARIKFI